MALLPKETYRLIHNAAGRLGRLSFFLSLTLPIVQPNMLSPVCYLLFLLSIIRRCITSSDLEIQVGELLPIFDAEPNNLSLPSWSPDQADTRVFSEVGPTQSIDQCRYNSNQKSRKMRFKRGEVCPYPRQPVKDNGRSGTEVPSQIVPVAGDNPATENSVRKPKPDDNLCPHVARYPVCADPAAFPIASDTLFLHDVSRMQLKYCRTCTYIINLSLPLFTARRQILVRC